MRRWWRERRAERIGRAQVMAERRHSVFMDRINWLEVSDCYCSIGEDHDEGWVGVPENVTTQHQSDCALRDDHHGDCDSLRGEARTLRYRVGIRLVQLGLRVALGPNGGRDLDLTNLRTSGGGDS